MIPLIHSIEPNQGPASGGDLVEIVGTGFAETLRVQFGSENAGIEAVYERGGRSIALVQTPAHQDGSVTLTLQNLDASGGAVGGEVAIAQYRYLRARIADQSDLTRLVRTLLRSLKRQLLENTLSTVSVDFDDAVDENSAPVAKVPSLVLGGPRMRENRVYSSNQPIEEVVSGASGFELRRRAPPVTVDLEFPLVGSSASTVELLNLLPAVTDFLNRHRYIEMLRDEAKPELGTVRWEMDPVGECQTKLPGRDVVGAFTWALVIRGVDLEGGLPLDMSRTVTSPVLDVVQIGVMR